MVKKVVCKVHSRSLPYYYDDRVSFFDLKGEKHVVKKEDFMDVTSEGGRFEQFYTYLVKTDLDVCMKMEGKPILRVDIRPVLV